MTHSPSLSRALATPGLRGLRLRRHAILSRVVLAAALWRQRQDLARLDDHLLRDIGVSHDEALAEAQRRPWDAPDHWKVR